MRIATLIVAAAAVSVAAMPIATATAHADAVTATVCRHGGGVVHLKPHWPHVCMGGSYDGAEVWS
jgi:Spy/CpxP family protein refolding chaperone